MKHIISLLLTVTLINMYWLDGDGDKTKSVLVFEYSDGTSDRLVVDKKDLSRGNASKISNEACKILNKKADLCDY
jgi:hypothetical protein